VITALAALAGAWGLWLAAGWVVAAIGLPFAALLQQAVLFVVALTLAERLLARFTASGEPHG
jgi:hypothetical protein